MPTLAPFALQVNAVAADTPALTARGRLILSRRALVNQLGGGRSEPSAHNGRMPGESASDSDNEAYVGQAERSGFLDRFAWTSMVKRVGQRWWRRHPANTVVQLAQPLLEHYASAQPFKLVAIAAVAGAVLVLAKPWRLLSVTAVLAAVMKTSDLADIVNTLMQTHAQNKPSNPAEM